MTDDQTYQDMAAMPRTRRLIGAAGARFTRSYVSYPLCCPSRATYLTGQYNHNNGVHTNTPPQGGVEALDAEHTLPVWLSAAGYRTSHIGKYLNGYGLRRKPDVPPGWTDWHGTVDKSTYQMYGYKMYENGARQHVRQLRRRGPRALPDRRAARRRRSTSIEGTAPSTPLFLSLMFVAPHGEVESTRARRPQPYIRPAPRDVGRYRRLRLPRAPRGERDVRDKPPYVRKLHRASRATTARIRDDFRSRRESLIAVDEAVEAVVGALARTGRLDSTYILFTSDNGFFQGEHRIHKGKYLAYDPSSHVPLLIRGPGIPPGTVSGEVVSNADLAPTILEAAGADRRPADGRALAAARSRATGACARAGRCCTRGSRRATSTATARRAAARRRVPRDPHRAATSTSSGSTARSSSTTARAIPARCTRATATAATGGSGARCTASSCACAPAWATSAASRSGRSAAERRSPRSPDLLQTAPHVAPSSPGRPR